MATCSRCQHWMGETTGPTPPIPGTLLCGRCREEEKNRRFNRSTALIIALCTVIYFAVAVREEWNSIHPAIATPPVKVPEQVLPEPGDDGMPREPEFHPLREAPVPAAMSLDF